MKLLLLLAAAVLLDIVVFTLFGVVARDLWAWFVAPLGVPLLSLPQAIGIVVLVGLLTYQYHDQTGQESLARASTTIMFGLVSWGIGALAHSYM